MTESMVHSWDIIIDSGQVSVARSATGAQAPGNPPPGSANICPKTKQQSAFKRPRTSKWRVSGSEADFLLFSYRRMEKGPKKQSTAADSKRGLIFFPTKGELEIVLKIYISPSTFLPAPKMTCCATRPSAAVAENGYLDQNAAPAQRRNS